MHDESPSAAETDWAQIVALYELLLRISDNPVVALNHAVAVGMSAGPRAGLTLLEGITGLTEDHRTHAVRAHLLEMAGEHQAAQAEYRIAARKTTSLPQKRYLRAQAERLSR